MGKTRTHDAELERLLLLEAEAIERAQSSFIGFVTYTKPDYILNWHHKLIAQYLEKFVRGLIKRLMIFTPPQHGKSELVSRRLPAFGFGINPDLNLIAASYGQDLASAMNRDVQRIIDTPVYRRVFPGTMLSGENIRTVSQGSWLRNSDIFEIVNHAGRYRGAGIGSGITGMGANLAIIDDPIKDYEEASSKTIREKHWEWYNSTFDSRLRGNAGILITMTRWWEDDLAGRLLKLAREDPKADQWVVLSLPAILEKENSYDPRKPGEVLWPYQADLERLEKIKSRSQRIFESLYQQRPSDYEGTIFKPEWWKFYKEAPTKFDRVIQTWDCTFKDGSKNDFVVGQVWGRKGADAFLLHQVRARMDIVKTIETIKTISQLYPMGFRKLIEDKANGPAIISLLKNKVPGLIPWDPKGESKESRANAVVSMIQSGNVYLPHPARQNWVYEFLEETGSFPQGPNDDQVDAMTMALIELYGKNTNRLRTLMES